MLRPEFDPQESHKKPGTVIYFYPWVAASRAYSMSFRAVRDPASKNQVR